MIGPFKSQAASLHTERGGNHATAALPSFIPLGVGTSIGRAFPLILVHWVISGSATTAVLMGTIGLGLTKRI